MDEAALVENSPEQVDQPNLVPESYTTRTSAFRVFMDKIYIHKLPSYGNKIFYGLGFLALTCLTLMFASGTVLAFMGKTWWLSNTLGVYVRSIHLWSTQAFFAILVLHVLVGFTTSGFKAPRRMIWVFGAVLGCLALIQTEFGYGLRGDFSSQFRAVSGADFWNGAYLGHILNPLNYSQEFAIHIAIIPICIILLFIGHYLLVHTYGIAKPYRADIKYKMVDADHTIMWIRGAVLVVAILTLAFFFHSPYVKEIRIDDTAQQNTALVSATLAAEFDHTSDTNTYMDSIDPYTFDTRQVFVVIPYQKIVGVSGGYDAWAAFTSTSSDLQDQYTRDASQYFSDMSDHGTSSVATTTLAWNPVVSMIDTLMPAAKNGLYGSIISEENPSSNDTYTLRFLSDMNLFEQRAAQLNMSTEEWGMAKDETGSMTKLPPGSWWLAPIGVLNHTVLLNDDNGDRDAGIILGIIMLIFITFPYIPYLNRLPELLHLAPFIWRE